MLPSRPESLCTIASEVVYICTYYIAGLAGKLTIPELP